MVKSPILTPLRKSIVINTASQLVGRFMGTATAFVVSILVIQRFGIISYGDFIKITSFVSPLYIIVDFGINAIFLQNAKDATLSRESTSWSTLLGVRLLLGLVLTVLALFIMVLLPQGYQDGYTLFVRWGIVLYIPSVFLHATMTTANAVFQKHLAYRLSAYSIAIGSAATILFFFIASVFFEPTDGTYIAVVATLSGMLIAVLVSLRLVLRLLHRYIFTFSASVAKTLLWESFPLGLTLIVNVLYFRIDTYILTLTRSTTEVGVYGFIYKIFEAAIVFPTFFMNVLFPILLGIVKHTIEKKLLTRVLFRIYCILSGSSLIVFGILWMSAQYLPLLRPEFAAGIPALRILGAGLPFFYISSATMWLLIVLRKRWQLVGIYFVSLLLNVFFNIYFIPMYGIIAAATVTVACEAFIVICTGILFISSIVRANHTIRLSSTANS